MKVLLLIGGLGFVLLFGLSSMAALRIHFRTGMKGSLFMGIGFQLITLGVLGITLLDTSLDSRGVWASLYDSIFLALLLVLIGGGFMTILGFIIVNTSESGLYVEIGEKTTFWQRVTGNVPILKDNKFRPPAMSKRTGLIFGISAITFGSLLIILNILFKIPALFIHIFITAIFAIVFGLLLVIFSVIYLDKKPDEK